MKCIICHGEDIEKQKVMEEIKFGEDVVYVPIEVLVCRTCGERYYDRRTMRFLERVEEEVVQRQAKLKEVGRVWVYQVS